jgi:hypothetical protein
VFLHRDLMGEPPGLEVDHIDSTATLDCRRENLRVATHQQNIWNRSTHRTEGRTSPYKGVFLDRTHGRFKASILNDGKRLSLGYFDTAEGAARAYDAKCQELRGEWAVLNCPEKSPSDQSVARF